MNRLQPLPPPSHLSHSALTFLDNNFHTATVLTESPNFVAELQTQCSELDRALDDLTRRLGAGLAKYASFSGEIHSLFDGVKFKLSNLSDTCSSGIVQDGGRGERDGKGFREELATLAKEVARLETVRVYADALETQMETVTTTLQSLASQMQQLSQQMRQQSVILTELSKKLGSKGVTQMGVTTDGDSVQREIEDTEKMKLDFDLNLSTKEKEEVSLLTGALFSRLINFQSPPENIHIELSREERKVKQEATINPKPPLELSEPPSSEPPPDSGQPVTTVPRRAPPPRPPDLQDSVDGVVYAIMNVKKIGNVQKRLGGPPLMSPEPPNAGCNSVHEFGIVAEGENVLEKTGAKREIGELCITLNLMGHMHKSLPPIFHLLHVSSSGQHSTPLLSHGSLNAHFLSVMCHADTMQCELGQFYNKKGQAQTNTGLLKNEFRWMVVSSNVSAVEIWSTTKTLATGNDMYQLPGLHYCLVFDHAISETPHHRRSTWQEVHTHEFSNLMILFTKQWILMNVFKYSVVVSSLKVLLSFLSCDDLLVLPIGEKMHVYMVGFYDDKSVFWKTTLIEKDRKYEHVSRSHRACIQIGAKLHDLVVLNAMLCGYGRKVHFVPSFNMISWCSSFFMNQQDSREFDFPMVVADNETGWIIFFTLNGLLNFVFDRGKFWCKGKMLQQGMHISALKLLNILVITCSSNPHYFSDYLLSMHGLVLMDSIELNSIKQAIGNFFFLCLEDKADFKGVVLIGSNMYT